MSLRTGIFSLLLFLCISSSAQVGVRVFNYRPTGEFGFVMKPLVSLEVGFVQPFDDDSRWRTTFGLTFLKMKPRMESFPIYGTMTSGGTTTVLPGEQSFQKYSIFQLIAGGDFAFVQQDPFNVFAGAGLIAGAASVEYTEIIPTYKEFSYSGGGILGGGFLRLGADYSINDCMGIYVTATRSLFLVTEPAGIFGANDYGIGFRYTWK